ncbi:hypothetical protein DFQ14_108137 [Halopolyspora algeriensis]|uniref:Uncharacterized protein n=1 Tax=Halopolyspora algeriensis TaxID=1500506 RepID=A0A368VQY5_9ACTN|nr:thioesterase [Halopolyspora algeriensis]RCW42877.1 hypothetical protein DFQ14_108137 [Halopolyspora algeriensis]TQM56654.1 hypothetical protein FHU43_1462 [Halopolyspora algeriensis]
MSSTAEMGDVLRALAQLRTGVDGLHARYGDIPTVRRIDNDLERLEIDVSELSTVAPTPPTQRSTRRSARASTEQGEVVEVPDTPYDPSLWRDVDDEGVGGRQPHDR